MDGIDRGGSGAGADDRRLRSAAHGADRVVSPAKLTGTFKLKNTSANRTVRLVAGKILYIGAQGQPIELEEARTEPALHFSILQQRLDPGQEATQSVGVAFPAEALKAKNLKAILEETMDFTVSMSEGK